MFISIFLFLNPFLFQTPEIDPETNEGLAQLTTAISEAAIPEKLDALFLLEQQRIGLSDADLTQIKQRFSPRICRGVNQTFDSAHRKKELIKINKGGKRCIVTTIDATLRRNPELLEQLAKNLEATGFDGYLYYRIGGFPTPQETELEYAATPYSFKIFLMNEAHLLGFDSVLWVDARLIPIRSLEPIFTHLEKHHSFFVEDRLMVRVNFLSLSIDALKDLLKINPLDHVRIATPLFGLDFTYFATDLFLRDYYDCCKNGLCFISVFPEEHVISCIVAKYKSHFAYVTPKKYSIARHLWIYDPDNTPLETLEFAHQERFIFFGLSEESQHQLKNLRLETRCQ